MASDSLLFTIGSQLTIDVDSMDPAVAKRHTDNGFKFCDMTSNQGIAYSEASRPDRVALVDEACKLVKSSGEAQPDVEAQVDDVVDIVTVLLAKSVYPYLTGRVHAQTSTTAGHDTEKTINHAKKLVALFEAHGIPKSRVCIKIPTTPECVVACQYLEKLGIPGCLYIAPYFNELRVHFEKDVWKEYQDTAKEHPMARVIHSIVHVYKNIPSHPLVMPASIVTAAEVVALTSLGPDHLTLSGSVLDQLASAKGTGEVQKLPYDGSGVPDLTGTDFLADGGAALKAAIAADAETARKLEDALKIFVEMEEKLKGIARARLQGGDA